MMQRNLAIKNNRQDWPLPTIIIDLFCLWAHALCVHNVLGDDNTLVLQDVVQK